jgi:starch synthase (maltosyl-transferring)
MREAREAQRALLRRVIGRADLPGTTPGNRPASIGIEHVRPDVDCGRYAVKRVVNDEVVVDADVFAHGHAEVAVRLEYRHERKRTWKPVPMELLVNDRWIGRFPVDELGTYRFRIVAWVDELATWGRDFGKKLDAGVATDLDREEGARIAEQCAKRASNRDRTALEAGAARLRAGRSERTLADVAKLVEVARRAVDLEAAAVFDSTSPVWVDRPLARYSAWYEMFPRSASPDPARPGTLADVTIRLPYVASMGFDVLYLPPIHPIGTTNRKGRNNAVRAQPSDPGSPWAIGGETGGHTAIEPALGTLDDLAELVDAAHASGIEVALDLAFQASPDHPWVREHPQWFRHRPDGSIAYAENPPKRYEDIYPIDFDTEDRDGLWQALLDVVRFWTEHGIRVFRVDNPHTKPFDFWEWLIARIRTQHPETIFLAEAFTRPRVMELLAKIGFTQSYTYFTWRNVKWEIEEYFRELSDPAHLDYFRPNVWPNTPDILHETLQYGSRSTFIARLLLAAGLSANYGIYGPVFELQVRTAREAGSEEYLDSEKYEIKHWDLDRDDSLRHLIGRVNAIRREHPALQRDDTLRFHHIDNDMIVCWSKTATRDDGTNDVVLLAVNLDSSNVQSGWTALDLTALGLGDDESFTVHDLLTDARYDWSGRNNFVQLDPATVPAHVFAVRTQAPAAP